jgi:hypothetical protein
VHRQSLLCRVLFLGHSVKRFAECQGALGKEKRPLRRRGDGDGFFAECQGRHSANELTLPSACPVALGKDSTFAECPLGHSANELTLPSACPVALGKDSTFAKCPLGHSAKSPPGRVPMSGSLPSALCGTRQSVPLCRVPATTLGKVPKPVPRSLLFAECYGPDARQSTSLPSVTLDKVTRIYIFICFLYSIHTNKRYHIYTSHISSQT